MPRNIGLKRIYSRDFPDRDDVVRWDVLPVAKDQSIKVTMISSNAKNKQGVRFGVDAGRGYIEFNGQRGKDFAVWWAGVTEEITFKCHSVAGLISIYNAYLDKRGLPAAYMYKSGMLIEEQGDKRIYHCNDVNDGDIRFDKLVFSVEKI